MGYVGAKPSAVPLTSADITDGIITSAKIADGTIVNADINASAGVVFTKLASTGTLTVDNIQFPATQVASANANTLDDYEEGSWTPVGNGVTLTAPSGWYTKVGNVVHIGGSWEYPSTANANAGHISGLPFTVVDLESNYVGSVTITNYGSDNLYLFVNANDTKVLTRTNTNSDLTNANLSTKFVKVMASYRI